MTRQLKAVQRKQGRIHNGKTALRQAKTRSGEKAVRDDNAGEGS
jgi:hypothetical protein